MYQHKSFLNGKTGLVQVKQTGRGFQKAPQCGSNNFPYAVAELCYIHQHADVEGSNPSSGNGIAQRLEHSAYVAGSNPAPFRNG